VAFFAAFLAGAFFAAFFVAMVVYSPSFDLHRVCNTNVAVTECIWFSKNCVKKKTQNSLFIFYMESQTATHVEEKISHLQMSKPSSS
jgi:hypothetical protein